VKSGFHTGWYDASKKNHFTPCDRSASYSFRLIIC
jgi:hypothetical protein